MAISFLKKAKEYMPQRSVKYLLHRHLSGYDKARSLKTIHASSLTKPEGLCPRMYALHDVTGIKSKDEWLTTSSAVTFQMGRDLEWNVVNWFADMGKAVCHWKCIACGTLHEFQTRPLKCQQCGVSRFDPKEVRFVSAVNGASCGVDMLVAVGETKLRPIELKTIDKDEFKALKAPLAEHRWRTNLYLRLIAESDHSWSNMVSTEVATVLYVSKGGFGCQDLELKKWGLTEQFSPFKEFEIKRDDSQTDDITRRAKAIKDFREGKVGMPCGICPTAMVKRASMCALKSACFSGDHPPNYDWMKDGD
ncbi:MAG: hypothetical protein KJZ83_00200 [Burkholderiaceae bacterium]|nr:hypothetical protein [Burkholderiaceae bacterium]